MWLLWKLAHVILSAKTQYQQIRSSAMAMQIICISAYVVNWKYSGAVLFKMVDNMSTVLEYFSKDISNIIFIFQWSDSSHFFFFFETLNCLRRWNSFRITVVYLGTTETPAYSGWYMHGVEIQIVYQCAKPKYCRILQCEEFKLSLIWSITTSIINWYTCCCCCSILEKNMLKKLVPCTEGPTKNTGSS